MNLVTPAKRRVNARLLGALLRGEAQRYTCEECGQRFTRRKPVERKLCLSCQLKHEKQLNNGNEKTARNNLVLRAVKSGIKKVDIASELGISRQRVHQIITAAKHKN